MNSLRLIALDNFPLVEPDDNLINLIHSSINENNLNIEAVSYTHLRAHET